MLYLTIVDLMCVLLIPPYACLIYAVRASAARGQLQSPISTLLLFNLQMRAYALFDHSGFIECASDTILCVLDLCGACER